MRENGRARPRLRWTDDAVPPTPGFLLLPPPLHDRRDLPASVSGSPCITLAPRALLPPPHHAASMLRVFSSASPPGELRAASVLGRRCSAPSVFRDAASSEVSFLFATAPGGSCECVVTRQP